jgi:hypothetical protein
MSINLHKFPTLETYKQNEKKPHSLLNEASTFIISYICLSGSKSNLSITG